MAESTCPVMNTRHRKRSLESKNSDGDEEGPNKKVETDDSTVDLESHLVDAEGRESDSAKVLECAVCLQTCVHPARLPCNHIFCFLCLKGIAHGSKSCAMCRQPIPADYLDHPDLVELPQEDKEKDNSDEEEYKWFYEGRNGWWQYDCRTTAELEAAYTHGESRTEVLIAGYVYTVDLVEMVQSRKSDPARRRNIKRDLASCPKKGIAGLRTASSNCLALEMAKLNIDQT